MKKRIILCFLTCMNVLMVTDWVLNYAPKLLSASQGGPIGEQEAPIPLFLVLLLAMALVAVVSASYYISKDMKKPKPRCSMCGCYMVKITNGGFRCDNCGEVL